jgi:hypothetical protein
MTKSDSLVIEALATLLRETLLRADHAYAYVLNPGDPGLVETLKSLAAATVSVTPGPARKSIAAHAHHVLYGIELANRALGGEVGVYENADWDVAWTLQCVSETQWRDLVNRLEQQSRLLLEQVRQVRQWDATTLTGTLAIAAHAAYHLGAIRQMLLGLIPPQPSLTSGS